MNAPQDDTGAPHVALKAAWTQACQEPSGAQDLSEMPGRRRVLEALQVLLDEPAAVGSMVRALQALRDLVADPGSVLPEDLGTALKWIHDSQTDLQLRQWEAAQGLSPSEAASAPPLTAPPLTALPPPPLPRPQRRWWDIPVDGLTGGNQLFVLESRELLRGAELALQTLRDDPGDYAEQMVMCRAFQAVSVAAASMGLRRLSALARAGEQAFDQRLDDGGACDEALLGQTEQWLDDLYGELLDLMGETRPAPDELQATGGLQATERLRAPGSPEPSLAASQVVPVATLAWSEETVVVSAHGPADEPLREPLGEPKAEQKPELGPELGPELKPESVEEPAGAPRPAPPSRAPWWWAIDWSIWPEGPSTAPGTEHRLNPAESTELGVYEGTHKGTHEGTQKGTQEGAQEGRDPSAEREESPTVRVSPALLEAWAQTLNAWAIPDSAGDAAATVPSASLADLAGQISQAARLTLEAGSVSLYRTVRRAAREAGLTVDFDLEGASSGGPATLLAEVMPVVESLLEQRVSGAAAQGRAALVLRVRASQEDGLLRLQLLDLGGPPGPDTLAEPNLPPWPAPDTPAWSVRIDDWIARGAGWHPATACGWRLNLPAQADRVTLMRAMAGQMPVHWPSSWVVRQDVRSSAELAEALGRASLDEPDGPWPLLRLSALVKTPAVPLQDSPVVFLGMGVQRLALQVDSPPVVLDGYPSTMVAGWEPWRRACGVWGAARDGQGRLLVVSDPFALARRFGPAARALSRSSALRLPRAQP